MRLAMHNEEAEPVQLGSITVTKLSESQVANIHQQSGHPGVKRTVYFARSVNPSVSTTVTKSVIKNCKACRASTLVERKTGRKKQLE